MDEGGVDMVEVVAVMVWPRGEGEMSERGCNLCKGKVLNRMIMGKVGNGADICFWIDTWVGDLPFMERWLYLFVLDACKSSRVKDRIDTGHGNGGLSWNWAKQPETDTQLREWQERQDMISMVRLSNDTDSWRWNNDSQEGLAVKSVKKFLIVDRGSSQLPNIEWCKWVLIKCNIMAWRSNLDRLTTRVNLRRRNVNITTVMCSFCDEYEEYVDHLFTVCSVAIRVWMAVSVWCNIPPIFAFRFKDLMDIHNSLQIGKKTKKIILGLVIITCWYIWKGRNKLVFKQIRRSSQDILVEIKLAFGMKE
ncbi:uncharacterized protein LOC110943320 [Helianthus annuus]|uniref:uncharacterized protein LOC110943320 n=1 Tax=Helianthus annuus TaxID=4232 RepID=UPI000B8FEAB3|nr:uncharacterized protein LOC110943320 [Helianthus annuus]